MKFSLLIVNYNTENYIKALLDSLLDQTMSKSDFEIIISNNVQNDKLEEMIESNNFRDVFNIKMVQIHDNIGFGRATNAAAEISIAKHLLIVNPDILMTDKKYLDSMYSFILSNPNYGAISSKILNDNHHDGCEYYSYEFSEDFGYNNEICWFEGSLLFITKGLFEKLEGFDDDFFMYCEDVDLCYRIRKQGFPLIKNSDLSVYHKGGSSEPNKDYAFYHRWYKSKILFMHKHYNANQFDSFIKNLERSLKIKKIRYIALGIFSKKYKHKVLKNQVMLDIIRETIDSSASCLY